jgi:hypothetical protein
MGFPVKTPRATPALRDTRVHTEPRTLAMFPLGGDYLPGNSASIFKMTLNQYAAERRLAVFEDLRAAREPRLGTFDAAVLAEARTKGHPQMGTTRYSPNEIVFEYIYPDRAGAAVILCVSLATPERVVFLPVPSWVVENIWQGDVQGTHHFESEAIRLLRELEAELTPEGNVKWFAKQAAKRRE